MSCAGRNRTGLGRRAGRRGRGHRWAGPRGRYCCARRSFAGSPAGSVGEALAAAETAAKAVHVVTCYGGAARAGRRGGSVSGTRVEGGRSGLLCRVSPPAVPARLCQRASERAGLGEFPVRSRPHRLRGAVRSSPPRSVTPSFAASRRFRLGRFPPASSCSPLKLQR